MKGTAAVNNSRQPIMRRYWPLGPADLGPRPRVLARAGSAVLGLRLSDPDDGRARHRVSQSARRKDRRRRGRKPGRRRHARRTRVAPKRANAFKPRYFRKTKPTCDCAPAGPTSSSCRTPATERNHVPTTNTASIRRGRKACWRATPSTTSCNAPAADKTSPT